MKVYEKLQKCRVELQNNNLKKSGVNNFAGYSYYELSDFLPTINQLMLDNKLCSVIAFTSEIATLTIIDTEDGTKIEFTSPMAEAQLKGTHPIQNLGAVETYQRRYLYMNAFEIVEHDALDGTTGKDDQKSDQKTDEAKISKSQATRLYALSKANVKLIAEVLNKYGYQKSEEIKVSDYNKIAEDIEKSA